MTSRLLLTGTVMLLCLAGCGNSGGDSTTTTDPSTSTSVRSSGASPRSAGPAETTRALGEPVGIGCTNSSELTTCAATVTLTKIEPTACPDDDAGGKRSLRIAADATVAPGPDLNGYAGRVVNYGNWYAQGADDFTTLATWEIDCELGEPGPFNGGMEPGDKQRGEIVISVPKNSQTLVLRPSGLEVPDTMWAIPAAN